MSPKNKKGKKLTSTIMALAMTVTTTFQMPIISMASEIESSVAVESQIEEGTSEESVSVQSETTAQTNAEQTNSVIGMQFFWLPFWLLEPYFYTLSADPRF